MSSQAGSIIFYCSFPRCDGNRWELIYSHGSKEKRERLCGLCAVLVIEVSCPTCQHYLYPWLPNVNTWHNLETQKVLLLLLFTLSMHGDDNLSSLTGKAISAFLSYHRFLEIWAVNLLQFLFSVPSPATLSPPFPWRFPINPVDYSNEESQSKYHHSYLSPLVLLLLFPICCTG